MFAFLVLVGWTVVAVATMVLMGQFIAAGRGALPLRRDRATPARREAETEPKIAGDGAARDDTRRAA
jgi:hypothetical protein